MFPTRLSLVLLASATTLASCAGGGAVVPADVAEDLAAQAETVAQLVEEGDGCAAQEEAAALRSDVESHQGGALTQPVADELLGALTDLEAQIDCTPPEPDPPPEEDDRGGGGGEGKNDKDDKDEDEDKDEDKDEEKELGGNERKNEKKNDEGGDN